MFIVVRSCEYGLNDSFVPGAATEISSQCFSHVLLCRIRITTQKRRRIHQEAGRAEAALQRVVAVKSLLQCAQFAVLGQSLDGCDLMTVCLYGQHQTRAERFAVEEHRASAARAVFAADVSACQS